MVLRPRHAVVLISVYSVAEKNRSLLYGDIVTNVRKYKPRHALNVVSVRRYREFDRLYRDVVRTELTNPTHAVTLEEAARGVPELPP